MIRRQIAGELGMVIPRVRIHDEIDLDSHEYVFKVRGSEVARGRIMAGHLLAMDPGDAVGKLAGHPDDRAGVRPARDLGAPEPARRGRGARVHGRRRRIGDRHAPDRDDPHARRRSCSRARTCASCSTSSRRRNEAVVNEVVPDVLTLGEIQRVLQSLLGEGVSIRDLGVIVEAVGDKARLTRDPSLLAEYARQALGRAITAPYLDANRTLHAITLDPAIEHEVVSSITQTTEGEYLAMEPSRAQAVLIALRHQTEQRAAPAGCGPVLLCSARVRRHLRRLVESTLPHLAVCSYNEIASGISVETIGVVNT